MKRKAILVEDQDSVSVTTVGEDHALVNFNGERVVMTYDAAYDFAMQLAAWIQRTGDGESEDIVFN